MKPAVVLIGGEGILDVDPARGLNVSFAQVTKGVARRYAPRCCELISGG